MAVDSLWGDEFVVDTSPKTVKKVINKVNNPRKPTVVKERVIKSTKISLVEKLRLIAEEVYRILGKYKENTVVIKTREQLTRYIDAAIANGEIAIDTETNNSLEPITCKLMGPCIYTPGQKNAYIPINHVDPNTLERLDWQLTEEDIKEEFLRLTDTKIIMHNGKFDYKVIKCTTGIELKVYWDTLVGSRLLDENERANLKQQYISKIDPSIEKYSIEELFKGVEYAVVSPELFALYAATDAFMTYQLYLWQKTQFEKVGMEKLYNLFMNIEMPIMEVAAAMELTGITIDTEYAERLSRKYHKQLDELDIKLAEALKEYDDAIKEWRKTPDANFKAQKVNKAGEITYSKSKSEQLENPVCLTSPTQLAILFYDVLDVGVIDKKAPRGTGEEILNKIGLPICDLILEKRGLEKLVGTYVDKLPQCVIPETGRLHAHFNSLGADTGRFSCIAEGTKISMPGGDKNIEDVAVGDFVYCYDVEHNKLKLRRVLNTFNNGIRNCVKLSWMSKYNKALTGELICTPDHMIRTVEGWKEAQDVKPTDSILYVHRRNDASNTALYANFGQGNEEEHVWLKENHFNKHGKEFHVHHVDGNRNNNDPSNLMVSTPAVHTAAHLASKLPSNNNYCGRYNYSYEELIRMAEDVNWELTKIPHDLSTVWQWYQSYRINYIQKYTESYSKRAYTADSTGKHSKKLHLPLSKTNLVYALDLADGDTVLGASYFGITEEEFIAGCNKFELLSNHNVYKIEWLTTPLTVYDLEIEEYHNFIANELCVHNCSDPNLQNIPSHNKNVRMMFCAGYTESKEDITNNQVSVSSTVEVETITGWKLASDIVVGDLLTDKIETCEVTEVTIVDNRVLLTLKEVVQSC